MTVRLNFKFDNYDDLNTFLNRHEEVINNMSDDEVPMVQKIRNSVKVNEQLPEHFEFNDSQMGAMIQKDARGMNALMQDDLVDVQRKGENDGDE